MKAGDAVLQIIAQAMKRLGDDPPYYEFANVIDLYECLHPHKDELIQAVNEYVKTLPSLEADPETSTP